MLTGRTSALATKLSPAEKFASEIFGRKVQGVALLQRKRGLGERFRQASKQNAINNFTLHYGRCRPAQGRNQE
jgi:hypothetical protein